MRWKVEKMTETTQLERNRRAKKVSVESLDRVREDVYIGDFVNDRGEHRENVVLIPTKLFSSSEDMIYRSADGYVGKYMLAAVQESREFRDQLVQAIEERIEHLEDESGLSDEEESALREALDVTSDESVQAEIVRRLQEGDSEVSEAIDRLQTALQRASLKVVDENIDGYNTGTA